VDDRLSRAGDATGAVDVGVIGQAVGGVLKRLADPCRRSGIAIGDVAGDLVQVGARIRIPDDGKRHLTLARSIISHMPAIT
jgi:hypothetical protein